MNSKIIEKLPECNLILLYQQNLLEIYKNHKHPARCVFISSPKEGKGGLQKILKVFNVNGQSFTINQILNEIEEKVRDDEVHIFIDFFEQLTRRELEYYKRLSGMMNVSLIVNVVSNNAEFVDMDFIHEFIILNDNFFDSRSESVNVKYAILIVLSLFIFLVFLKMQLSIISIVVSTLWFTFLMYRSFYYLMH